MAENTTREKSLEQHSVQDKTENQQEKLIEQENDQGEVEEVEKSCKDFWEVIEEEIGVILPVYLKNILNMTGFNNDHSMKGFEASEHLPELETFARNVISEYANAVCPPESKENYLGIFAKCPKLFTIASGHKIMFQRVSDFCKKRLNQQEMLIRSKVKGPKRGSKSQSSRQSPVVPVSSVSTAHQCEIDKLAASILSSIHQLKGLVKSDQSILEKPVFTIAHKNGESSSATIYCPVCSVGNCAFKKDSNITAYFNQGRWVLSNYRRHCSRFHSVENVKTAPQITIKNMLERDPVAGTSNTETQAETPRSPASNSESSSTVPQNSEFDDDDDAVNPKRRRQCNYRNPFSDDENKNFVPPEVFKEQDTSVQSQSSHLSSDLVQISGN